MEESVPFHVQQYSERLLLLAGLPHQTSEVLVRGAFWLPSFKRSTVLQMYRCAPFPWDSYYVSVDSAVCTPLSRCWRAEGKIGGMIARASMGSQLAPELMAEQMYL